MANTTRLRAEAIVPLDDPTAMLARLSDHFAAHATVHRRPGGATIEGRFGRASLAVAGNRLCMEVEAADATALAIVKMGLAEQIATLAGGVPPTFAWSDSAAAPALLPYFHALTVARSEIVTPKMRRVVVSGDVARLASAGLHVRVLIPPKDRAPEWPMMAADGRVLWPEGAAALTPRVYTLRHLDLLRGEASIDVVQHAGAATPGSDWARNVRPGDRVGLLGPGGAGPDAADHLLLAGDETALPAIARVLAELPATTRATVRVEIADPDEQQPLPTAAALDLQWLNRDGAPAGTTSLLADAVRAVEWPRDRTSAFAWIGCEQSTARALRRHLNGAGGLAKSKMSVAAYWRLGSAEVEAGA